MSLKFLFTLSAVVLAFLGAGLLFLPNELISLRTGQAPVDLTLHIARQFGVLALALASITWFIRDSQASKERSAVILGLVFAFSTLPIETAFSIMNGSESSEGWVLVLIFTLIAAGFISSKERRNLST